MITWHQGQRVYGVYCGFPYQGRLNEDCRPTPDHKNTIYSVTLTDPIMIYGSMRTRVEIWSNGNDTIHFE